MAAASIGKLHVMISGSSAELEKTLDRVEIRLRQTKAAAEGAGGMGGAGGIGGLAAGLGKVGIAVAAITAAVAAAKQLDDELTKAGQAADELADTAEALGASKSGLFGLRAASLGSRDALDSGLEHLSRLLGEAVNGSDAAEKSFSRLNLSAAELASLPLDEAMLRVNDAIKDQATAAQRNAAAFDVYGRSGQKLMEMIGRGSKFSRELESYARERGAIGSSALAEEMDQFEVATKRAEVAMQGLKNTLAEMTTGSKFQNFKRSLIEDMDDVAKFFRNVFGGGDKVSPALPGVTDLEAKWKAIEAAELAATQAAESRATAATTELDKLNASLDEQAALLRLTELGWAGVEKEMLAVHRAVAAGADIDQAIESVERLSALAEANRAAARAKEIEQTEQQILNRLGGFRGRGLEFAGVALAGSREAADAFNQQFAGGGAQDIPTILEQIRQEMTQNKFDSFTREQVRKIAEEVTRLNRNLDPLGPAQ